MAPRVTPNPLVLSARRDGNALVDEHGTRYERAGRRWLCRTALGTVEVESPGTLLALAWRDMTAGERSVPNYPARRRWWQ